jgi:hypothetical protein
MYGPDDRHQVVNDRAAGEGRSLSRRLGLPLRLRPRPIERHAGAREERQWQEAQTVRERQEAAADQLRAAVIDVQKVMPQEVRPPADATDDLNAAHRQLREAWTRASLLTDEGVERCFSALDMALFIATQDTIGRRTSDEQINFWPLSIAAIDLRKALDALLRREPLPEPAFPSSQEQIEIAGSQRNGLEQIRDALVERRVM